MRYIIFLPCALLIFACSKAVDSNEAVSEDKAGNITVVMENDSIDDNVSQFIGYGITGENVVKYSPDGEETSITKEIGANIVIRNHPYESIHRSLLKKKLSKAFIVKCSACHDDYGNGVIGPSLLTKTSDEVFNMIAKYKSGSSDNILMHRLVSKMTDEEIRFLADDISKFNEEVRRELKK